MTAPKTRKQLEPSPSKIAQASYRKKRITRLVLTSDELNQYAKSVGASYILVCGGSRGRGRNCVKAIDIFGMPLAIQRLKAYIQDRIQTLEASTDDFTTKKDRKQKGK